MRSFYSHSIYGQVDVGKLVVEIAFFLLGIDRTMSIHSSKRIINSRSMTHQI